MTRIFEDARLREELKDLRAKFREVSSWKVEIKDPEAFAGIDVRQAHAYLYKRGFRNQGWVIRSWRHKTIACDVEGDGKGFQFICPERNGFGDHKARMGDVVRMISSLFDVGPIKVLFELRATKPRDLLKPFFAVGDRVCQRFDRRIPSYQPKATLMKGTLGTVTGVDFVSGQKLVYTVAFDGFGSIELEAQMDIEHANLLDRVAEAAV